MKIEGITRDGCDYSKNSDILLWLATVGEMPNLNRAQRDLISALIKDFRAMSKEEVKDQ